MGKIESIEFAIELIEKEMNNAIDQDWLQKAYSRNKNPVFIPSK